MPPRDKPTTCVGCPAFDKGRGFVPPSGPTTARVALIAQGPGKEEADGHWSIEKQESVHRPLIGRSGQKLDRWLERVNSEPGLPALRREECRVLNVVQCHLTNGKKDRAPTPREVEFCKAAHWGPWLAEMPNLQVVVPIGVPAIKALLGEGAGELWAGGTYKLEGSNLW